MTLDVRWTWGAADVYGERVGENELSVRERLPYIIDFDLELVSFPVHH